MVNFSRVLREAGVFGKLPERRGARVWPRAKPGSSWCLEWSNPEYSMPRRNADYTFGSTEE